MLLDPSARRGENCAISLQAEVLVDKMQIAESMAVVDASTPTAGGHMVMRAGMVGAAKS